MALLPIEPGDMERVIGLARVIGTKLPVPPDVMIDRDDVVQECVLGALKAARSWQPGRGTTFQAWVYRFAVWAGKKAYEAGEPRLWHEGHRYIEEEARRPPLHLSAIERVEDLFPVSSASVVETALAKAALARLAEEDRTLFVLHVAYERTIRDLAAASGVTEGVMRGRMCRALYLVRLVSGGPPVERGRKRTRSVLGRVRKEEDDTPR